MIGRVGQPSDRAIYSILCHLLKSINLTKIRKLSGPKPKTPKNPAGEKRWGNMCPQPKQGSPLGFYGIVIKRSKHELSKLQ